MAKAGRTRHLEPQMQLGRRLAPAVPRPVHTVGDQLDRGRVDRMGPDFVAVQQAPPLALGPDPVAGRRRVDEGARNILEELPRRVGVVAWWRAGRAEGSGWR